jgi:hypothetical protein
VRELEQKRRLGTPKRNEIVTLSSMARLKAERLQVLLQWLDQKRAELEQRALQAEDVGRRIAEERQPQLRERDAAVKQRANRERWLRGEGAAAEAT